MDEFSIKHEIPAILNFLRLNKLDCNSHTIAPLSKSSKQFVRFSERNLVPLFWKNEKLREQMKLMTHLEERKWTLKTIEDWIKLAPPGALITTLLSTVGRGKAQINDTSYQRSTKCWNMDDIRLHLRTIREPGFDANSYQQSGHILRGAIITDGHRIHLEAFKLCTLLAAKFKRLENLPCRLTTTVAGTADYLTEIRNIVRTREDVQRIWGCDPCSIKIIGIDLGQAFVVGVSALLPDNQPNTDQFHNLSVNQKAVCQPMFRFRKWEDGMKVATTTGTSSIKDIESALPALRGKEASFSEHIRYRQEHQKELTDFYGLSHKKHRWDMIRAKQEEYDLIANQILALVGGTLGKKRTEDNKVAIGVGLGKFQSNMRLTSLHGSFEAFFVNKVSAALANGLKTTRSTLDLTKDASSLDRPGHWDTLF